MNKEQAQAIFADPATGINRVGLSLGVSKDRLLAVNMLCAETAQGLPANEAGHIAFILKTVWAKLDNDTEKQFAMFIIGGWMEKTLSKKPVRSGLHVT